MAGRSQYTMDEREKLIAEVQAHPELWDRSHPKHRDTVLCNRIWDEIAHTMAFNRNSMKKLWKSLVDIFRRHYKNIAKKGPSGTECLADSDVQLIRWPFFQRLLFLSSGMSSNGRTLANDLCNDDTDGEHQTNSIEIENSPPHTPVSVSYSCNSPQCDLSLQEDTPAPPLSSKSETLRSRGVKRSRILGRLHEVDVSAELLKELRNVNNSIQQTMMNVETGNAGNNSSGSSKNTAVGDLLSEYYNKVPAHLQIRCMRNLLEVIEAYTDGQEVMIVTSKTVPAQANNVDTHGVYQCNDVQVHR